MTDGVVRSGARGEFGRAVPVRPMREPRRVPDRCPRGHRLDLAGVTVGWSPRYQLHQLTCQACLALDSAAASWCQLDPSQQHPAEDEQARAGLRLVVVPPTVPAGVGRIELRLDGHPVGDIDLALCGRCRTGVVEHVRVDPAWNRRGYGRTLLAAALTRGPAYDWSTTPVADHPVSRAFWSAVAPRHLEVGVPRRCSDLLAAATAVHP
ncbi:GNAT family N-acetyltransferase [Amycolatopsis arida]|uniref:GNAT family N-acetyltransferase n=1 Tax=Amycolatopsis arida TaxID=587909 RepID=UPI001064ED3D|nr:GNAT family N-acetyltransferase [Amycolatopsis arida]TDX84935.1 hypothetical protein CLV69_11719 [Amycolatopsis arida]